jgi:hypothetical protein
MRYLLIILIVFLSGCFSSEPDEELVRLFGDHCESLGHAKGSPEFNECVKIIGQKK